MVYTSGSGGTTNYGLYSPQESITSMGKATSTYFQRYRCFGVSFDSQMNDMLGSGPSS